MKQLITKSIPHLVAVATFLAASYIYFFPLLQGQELPQKDIIQFAGMAQEVVEHRAEHDDEPLWTNSMFGGMPAYFISTLYPGNLLKEVDQIFHFGERPASTIFFALLGFYILLLVLGVNPWLSLVGAFAYGLSTYFFIVIDAGHTSKMLVMSYVPPTLAGVILAFQGKYLAGTALFALFLGLNVNAGHVQITYYMLFIMVALGMAYLVMAYRDKRLLQFGRAVVFLAIGGLLAVGANFTRLYFSWDHKKSTIRGLSELRAQEGDGEAAMGLDLAYATEWSYGPTETFNLLIPYFKGGASATDIGTGSYTYAFLVDQGVPPRQARQIVEQMPTYWGPQKFTMGPVYLGAVVVLLFALGLLLVRGPLKWALLAVTALAIMLAWGRYFMPLTQWFMEHFPLYNRFRTVSMILFIAEVTFPLLGILGVKQIMDGGLARARIVWGLKWALGVVGGLCLFFALFGGGLFSFVGQMDQQYIDAGYPATLFDALREDRAAMLRGDALRSLVFVALAAAALLAFVYQKLSGRYLLAALGLLIVTDMWVVNRRHLDWEHFEDAQVVRNPFAATAVDQLILSDPTLHFRVFNLTMNPFNEARTSFFHRSVGGYHAAKLRRYQDVIDHYLATPRAMPVLNMLNTRWVIEPGEQGPEPRLNPGAFGNAWFADSLLVVENADAELAALGAVNLAATAIVDRRFAHHVEGYRPQPAPHDTIALTGYRADRLEYQFTLAHPRLAVFSEIYYPNGWYAYVNGQPVDHFRVNYILRAMILPAGSHQLTFEFKPRMYTVGYYVDLASSLVIILLTIGWLGHWARGQFRQN